MDERPDDAAETDLGHPGMDAEHRGQLDLMNQLERAIAGGKTCPEVADEIELLVSYLNAHFLSEQIAMREHAYPDYAAHLEEHDRAISLLRELETRCAAGNTQMTMGVVVALRGWLLAHIQTTDRKLAEFMVARGIALP